MEPTLAVDAVRAMNLQSRGYEIITAKIPQHHHPQESTAHGASHEISLTNIGEGLRDLVMMIRDWGKNISGCGDVPLEFPAEIRQNLDSISVLNRLI